MKYIILFLFIISCSKSETINSNNEDELTNSKKIHWEISENDLIGKFDPFPEIDSLQFTSEPIYLNKISNKHRVALVNIEDQNLVFLFGDLGYFEVLNFNWNGKSYAVSHCPITNTTLVFKLELGNKLKASGFRYRENLVMYNSKKDSYFSQMQERRIAGQQYILGNSLPLLDTRWGTIKNIYSNIKVAQVLDEDLGLYQQTRGYNSEEVLDWEHMSIGINNDKIKNNIDIIPFKKISSKEKFSCKLKSTFIIGDKNKNIVRVFILNENQTLSIHSSGNYLIDGLDKYDWNGYCFEGPNIYKQLVIKKGYLGGTLSFQNMFEKTNIIK
ncbi:uncharacterized protein DUF3179 [Maribacter vaceletii]|uniref:Uncharacterized protein DUF3179 n=1 Tax=Maribacter vaceletii TaxID=1206816 RepID=A0A495EAV6_9FLAO|nr:DUF3179 domain-containing (seleno)protein [Maribacter vaceletii]RKR14015.1 uncharacterized protein DUF3179 [Maribacter vaceletii]